ncbi:hypothetical protein [Bartonella machadoae]|nr:hypothetical protein [Bartonella machadoae]UNE53932.1 hypothetical protein LNM86_10160 [Bartonella machadoae]
MRVGCTHEGRDALYEGVHPVEFRVHLMRVGCAHEGRDALYEGGASRRV